MSRKTEDGSQKTEDGRWKSEVRNEKSIKFVRIRVILQQIQASGLVLPTNLCI